MAPYDAPPARAAPAPPRPAAAAQPPGRVVVRTRRERADGVVEFRAVERALSPQYAAVIGGRSLEAVADADCKARTLAVHSLVVYAGEAAQGRATRRVEETGWRAALPGATSGRLLDAACAALPPHGAASPPPPRVATRTPALPVAARGSGPWIQVASVDSAVQAQRLADEIAGRHGALVALRRGVAPAQVGGRTVYRVVFAGAPDRRAAEAACAALRAEGQACLIHAGA